MRRIISLDLSISIEVLHEIGQVHLVRTFFTGLLSIIFFLLKKSCNYSQQSKVIPYCMIIGYFVFYDYYYHQHQNDYDHVAT